MTTNHTAPVGARVEAGAQVLILLVVAGMAGAASFTHVHDWTMHNSPAHTPGWFGWANAVISELIPIGAGLTIRQRQRAGQPAGTYPLLLIVAAVALSLAGQVAEAKPGLTGALIAAVPALGFLALAKLLLTTPTPAGRPLAPAHPFPGPAPAAAPVAVPGPGARSAAAGLPARPAPAETPVVAAAPGRSGPEVPARSRLEAPVVLAPIGAAAFTRPSSNGGSR